MLSLCLGRIFFFLLPFLFFFLPPGAASADLVINEFLADPQGADAGQEFVELLNTGPGSFNLDGVKFQFANGSVGPEWTTRWQAAGPLWLAAGERFLLVDRNWMGEQPFQVEVWLGLQNGPDAIRLLQGGEVLDLVGYGPLTDPEMMEGAAAPLQVGLSLARKPDGHDTDNNNLDFFSSGPSAGQVNYLNYEIEVASVEMDPPSLPEPGSSVRLKVMLRNTGLAPIQPGTMVLLLQAENTEPERVLDTFFAGCLVDANCELVLVMTPVRQGRFTILLELALPQPEESLQVTIGKLQVGCGALFFSEVLAAPAVHQGEWIEIQAGSEDVNLGDYRIRDEEGGWRSLPPVELQPRQFLLVAQDSTALAAWHHENLFREVVLNCPSDQMGRTLRRLPGAWPSLNNSAPEGRTFADRVYLADLEGVVDHVTLPGDEQATVFRGKSWERMSHDPNSFRWGRWRSSVAASGGTPGCANSVAVGEDAAGVLQIMPLVLDRRQGVDVTRIRFDLGAAEMGWHVEIYDLWGKLIRDLGGGETGPGIGELIWDGRDDHGHYVRNGGYVVLLLKSREDGIFNPAAKHLLVVR